ncbi:hypothetical protein GGR54DRAFT_642927 [Hypoxylon sp. NC1633]|nr:hypothetical protein GGR54DRAFT_642927 [Hypoxylon sp. NC1633]
MEAPRDPGASAGPEVNEGPAEGDEAALNKYTSIEFNDLRRICKYRALRQGRNPDILKLQKLLEKEDNDGHAYERWDRDYLRMEYKHRCLDQFPDGLRRTVVAQELREDDKTRPYIPAPLDDGKLAQTADESDQDDDNRDNSDNNDNPARQDLDPGISGAQEGQSGSKRRRPSSSSPSESPPHKSQANNPEKFIDDDVNELATTCSGYWRKGQDALKAAQHLQR